MAFKNVSKSRRGLFGGYGIENVRFGIWSNYKNNSCSKKWHLLIYVCIFDLLNLIKIWSPLFFLFCLRLQICNKFKFKIYWEFTKISNMYNIVMQLWIIFKGGRKYKSWKKHYFGSGTAWTRSRYCYVYIVLWPLKIFFLFWEAL